MCSHFSFPNSFWSYSNAFFWGAPNIYFPVTLSFDVCWCDSKWKCLRFHDRCPSVSWIFLSSLQYPSSSSDVLLQLRLLNPYFKICGTTWSWCHYWEFEAWSTHFVLKLCREWYSWISHSGFDIFWSDSLNTYQLQKMQNFVPARWLSHSQ